MSPEGVAFRVLVLLATVGAWGLAGAYSLGETYNMGPALGYPPELDPWLMLLGVAVGAATWAAAERLEA